MPRSSRTFAVALFAWLLVPVALASQQSRCAVVGDQAVALTGVEVDSVARVHLTEAYRLLEADQIDAAALELEQAAAAEPCRATTHAQLGYAYVQAGRTRDALDELLYARELGYAEPRAALQIAYLAETLGDDFRARRYFVRAMDGEDEEVADQAEAELRVRSAAPGLVITEVYAAPVYQTRFRNLVVPVVVRSGPLLTADYLLQPYALLRVTRDTRSSYGERPQIFSENAALAGLGIRRRITRGTLTAYAEAGAVVDLDFVPSELSNAGPSFQAGLYDFIGFGLPRDPGGVASRGRFAELYFDASYYSRFDHNGIGYFQLRPGYRSNGWARGTLDLYAPLLAVADINGYGYNNLVEAGLGARFSTDLLAGLGVSAELIGGSYLRDRVLGDRTYADFRLTLISPLYFASGKR